MTRQKVGVILMTYGSPKKISDVPTYLRNVYGGHEPSAENVKEFQRRYSLIGGSPLVKITKSQAKALEKELNGKKTFPYIFKVVAGMRFASPFIHEVVPKLTKDIHTLVGIIMSPQYSPIIMSGYIRELGEAAVNTKKKVNFTVAQDWHLEPYFLKALATRVKEALRKIPDSKSASILFTAHSMPKRVIDKEPRYIDDLKETASEVAKIIGLSKKQWMFCYQSAGHTPEEWLKPDFADIMPILKKKGKKSVLIVPVQFLADHLEILYDIEVGVREQAEENGIQFFRTQSLNTSPLFIKALASIVKKEIEKCL